MNECVLVGVLVGVLVPPDCAYPSQFGHSHHAVDDVAGAQQVQSLLRLSFMRTTAYWTVLSVSALGNLVYASALSFSTTSPGFNLVSAIVVAIAAALVAIAIAWSCRENIVRCCSARCARCRRACCCTRRERQAVASP